MIDRLALDWYSAKTFLEHSIAFSDDVLHVLAGVGIQLVLAAIIRGSAANALPLAVLFGLELLNEASDLRFERWPDLGEQLGEGMKDIILTMLLPVVLFVIARVFPQLLSHGHSVQVREGEHELPEPE